MHTPGEGVKAKNEKHLTRTRAREREERKKTREELKGSPQVLFWSGGLKKKTRNTPYIKRNYYFCNSKNIKQTPNESRKSRKQQRGR